MRKIVSVMGIIGACAYALCSIRTDVQAAETLNSKQVNENYSTNGYSLYNYKNDSALCRKLNNEKKHHTGILKADVEESLNEIGIFDDEIHGFDEEMIKILNENSFLNVQIVYTGEDESGEMRHLKPEEVDEVIERNYSENSNTEDYAVSVAASTNSDFVTSPSGMLKQYIILAQSTSSKELIYVQYSAQWVEEPYYRNMDACSVSYKNASYEPDTLSGTYYCSYREIDLQNSKEKSYSVKKNLETYGELNTEISGMTSEFDLHLSRSGITAKELVNIVTEVDVDRINLNFYIRIDDTDISHVVVVGQYWHEQSSASINPSFESYYNRISGPYVLYVYK